MFIPLMNHQNVASFNIVSVEIWTFGALEFSLNLNLLLKNNLIKRASSL
jgi:hypothetical protein